jgi:hypothetical protein
MEENHNGLVGGNSIEPPRSVPGVADLVTFLVSPQASSNTGNEYVIDGVIFPTV